MGYDSLRDLFSGGSNGQQLTKNLTTGDLEWTPATTGGYATLANGATALALATNNVIKLTPTATSTLTTTVPPAGTRCTVLILTSGTTTFTLTFGTGFKPVGTLATGATSSRVFVLAFISDGSNLYEVSRTTAMVA